MKAAFRVRSTFKAQVAMDRRKPEIVKEAVTMAEKLDRKKNDAAIFDVHDFELKVVVQLRLRAIRIVTKEEADAAELPDKQGSSVSNWFRRGGMLGHIEFLCWAPGRSLRQRSTEGQALAAMLDSSGSDQASPTLRGAIQFHMPWMRMSMGPTRTLWTGLAHNVNGGRWLPFGDTLRN
jgi:hypothetical protein